MQEAFQYLNYQVGIAKVPEVAGWGGHDAWIGDRVRTFVQEVEAKNESILESTLLVIYYVGHGGVVDERLKGSRTQGYVPYFDITLLQTTLRESCSSDVFLILDCCNAGFIAPMPHQPYFGRQNVKNIHTMETLGACPATRTTAAEGAHNFTKRLAGELIFLGNSKRSISVDQLNSNLLQDWRYRARAHERYTEDLDGDAAYAGNVRVLNTGNRSIILGKLPAREGDGENGWNEPMSVAFGSESYASRSGWSYDSEADRTPLLNGGRDWGRNM
ncbi:hypothetical protein LTR36_009365 [Oleoguttula mirabilis]|uniref:Uncharacterized protein n=1 Tax=Oleoguttula mirabilis TaxID=1507867 RepID=A0AAV9JS13_9PEZI|nr:hypothetical protein LTR36_009365 [Oleoguttula mirabilis]